MQHSRTATRNWVRKLPDSKMVYPRSMRDQTKYLFWRFYTPFHPFFRDLFLTLGLFAHAGRQDFLLGTIELESLEPFVRHLIGHGFGNHFVAWKDDGEILGMRLVRNFAYQYHIRIFEDGEVRAHYEFTPECHPVLHMRDDGMEERRGEFLQFVGNWLAQA